jgi:hypothetical protein
VAVATKTTEVVRVTVILAPLKIIIREVETNNNLTITKILKEETEITVTAEAEIKRALSTRRRETNPLATVLSSRSSLRS